MARAKKGSMIRPNCDLIGFIWPVRDKSEIPFPNSVGSTE